MDKFPKSNPDTLHTDLEPSALIDEPAVLEDEEASQEQATAPVVRASRSQILRLVKIGKDFNGAIRGMPFEREAAEEHRAIVRTINR